MSKHTKGPWSVGGPTGGTRSLILHPHEIRAALRGELRLVVRPVAWNFARQFDEPREPEDVAAGYPMVEDQYGDFHPATAFCPLGVPGTVLRGKETWRVGAWREPGFNIKSRFAVDYQASPEIVRTPWIEVDDDSCATKLRCGIYKELVGKGLMPPHIWEPGKGPLRWRSPATMPAWASRITLVNEGVSVCRLGDITYEDAEKCGVADPSLGTRGMSPLTILRDLWNSRYAAKGLGWDSNPWVWKIAVKEVEK